jgi:primosomal replication protein N
LVALAAASGASASAQNVSIPREKHAWGRFAPGSWAKVRKVSQELDAEGEIQSETTTETKTTLREAGAMDCTVQMEISVEIAGKRFQAQTKTMRIGYNGDTDGGQVQTEQTGTGVLEFGLTSTRCALVQMDIETGEESLASRVWYSPSVSPYVLKRETWRRDGEGDPMRPRTEMKVLAVGMPYRVLGEIKEVAYARTKETHVGGSSLTLEVICEDVPGGVVAHASKDLDQNGRVVRRSTLQLIGYGTTAEHDSGSRPLFWFRRRNSRRTND